MVKVFVFDPEDFSKLPKSVSSELVGLLSLSIIVFPSPFIFISGIAPDIPDMRILSTAISSEPAVALNIILIEISVAPPILSISYVKSRNASVSPTPSP